MKKNLGREILYKTPDLKNGVIAKFSCPLKTVSLYCIFFDKFPETKVSIEYYRTVPNYNGSTFITRMVEITNGECGKQS